MGLIQRFVDGRVQLAIDNILNDVNSTTPVIVDEHWRCARNRVFFKSDSDELLYFYKTRFPKSFMFGERTNFYRVMSTGSNIPFMHYPLGNIITKTMTNLLLSKDPSIIAISGNKAKDKKLNKILDDIYKSNNMIAMLQKASDMCSYSGCVAFKPIIDKEFSEYPFFIPYPKEDIKVVKKYDKITEIIFTDIYEKNKDYFYLYTICGKGYIDYQLYHGKKDKNSLNQVPLTSLDETKDLHRIDFYAGSKLYNRILAIYIENKDCGSSDYKNSYDDFAALDEVYSNLVNYIRKSKLITYRPENTLDIDARTGRPIVPEAYDRDEIILYDKNPEGTKQEIKRDQIQMDQCIVAYEQAFNNILIRSLATAGISPASIGIDTAGANSSAEALNIRERVSLRTRDEKIKIWRTPLEDMFKLLLDLSTAKISGENAFLDAYEDDISVTFAEYESPTFNDMVTSLGEALTNNLIDIDTALRMLWPDKTEDEIKLMKMHITSEVPDEDTIINNEINKEDNRISDRIDNMDKDTNDRVEDISDTNILNDIRTDLQGEYTAIKGYESHADKAEAAGYKELANVLRDISDEEAIHCGELQSILDKHDKGYAKLIKQGMEENK